MMTLILIWVAVGIALILLSRSSSAGLPLAYFFGMSLIHVPGALIHLDDQERNWTLLGFEQTVIGTVAFLVGVILVKLIVFLRRQDPNGSNRSAELSQSRKFGWVEPIGAPLLLDWRSNVFRADAIGRCHPQCYRDYFFVRLVDRRWCLSPALGRAKRSKLVKSVVHDCLFTYPSTFHSDSNWISRVRNILANSYRKLSLHPINSAVAILLPRACGAFRWIVGVRKLHGRPKRSAAIGLV